jgi:uroporphyrinogen-III decarboxylase
MEVNAGMDVRELAPLYGHKVAFMGNISVPVLSRGNPDEIRHEVISKVEAVKKARARFIFHSDHSAAATTRFIRAPFLGI